MRALPDSSRRRFLGWAPASAWQWWRPGRLDARSWRGEPHRAGGAAASGNPRPRPPELSGELAPGRPPAPSGRGTAPPRSDSGRCLPVADPAPDGGPGASASDCGTTSPSPPTFTGTVSSSPRRRTDTRRTWSPRGRRATWRSPPRRAPGPSGTTRTRTGGPPPRSTGGWRASSWWRTVWRPRWASPPASATCRSCSRTGASSTTARSRTRPFPMDLMFGVPRRRRPRQRTPRRVPLGVRDRPVGSGCSTDRTPACFAWASTDGRTFHVVGKRWGLLERPVAAAVLDLGPRGAGRDRGRFLGRRGGPLRPPRQPRLHGARRRLRSRDGHGQEGAPQGSPMTLLRLRRGPALRGARRSCRPRPWCRSSATTRRGCAPVARS